MDAVYNMLGLVPGAAALQDGVNLKGDGAKSPEDDFQKLLDQKAQSAKAENRPKEQSKTETSGAKKPEKAPAQKQEDPVETAKRLQVYLAPVSAEELSQYPEEWLPIVQEGEPIVCIGVTTDGNGQQMPILIGANEARSRGWEVATPEMMEQQPQGEIEVPEELMQAPERMEQAPVIEDKAPVVRQGAEEAQPQQKDDTKVEVTDAEQAPQRLFHDVKAAPVKVGEVYDAQKAEEPDVAQQIDAGLAQALENGESLVRIQLNPENLGTVTVEISQNADGALRVALSAHSGETRGLLERHAGDLQGLLSSRTQQNVQVDVQRGQESQQNQNQQHSYDGRNGHAQDQQERRQQRQEHAGSSQDFIQQLRLGLIPTDGEE